MANSTVATLTAASPPDGTELIYAVQGGVDKKMTSAQTAAAGAPKGHQSSHGTGGSDPLSGLAVSQVTAAASPRLYGRSTTGSGAGEELQVGSGLSLAAGVLTATGGGGGAGFASPNFTGDGSTDNSTAASSLTVGSYAPAKPATSYKFSTSYAPPSGVHIAFPPDSFPSLADGILPSLTSGGRSTFLALPPRPLHGGRAGTIGSDFLLRGIDTAGTGSAPRFLGTSVLAWAAAASYGTFRPHVPWCFAAAAADSSALATQLTSLLAAGTPAYLFVEVPGGEASTTTAQTVASRVLNACFRAMSRGIHVVVLLPFARLLSGITDPIAKRNSMAATILRRACPHFGVLVFDPSQLMVDTTSANADPLASMTQGGGGITSDWCGRVVGSALGAAVRTHHWPSMDKFDRARSAKDAYDATYASAYGNLFGGALTMWQGTGGTKTGANSARLTGNVPSGMVVDFTGNSAGTAHATCTISVVVDSDNVSWLTFNVTEGDTAGTLTPKFQFFPKVAGNVEVGLLMVASWNSAAYNQSGLELSPYINYDPGYAFQPRTLFFSVGSPGSFDVEILFPEHAVPSDTIAGSSFGEFNLPINFAGRGSSFTHTFQVAAPTARMI